MKALEVSVCLTMAALWSTQDATADDCRSEADTHWLMMVGTRSTDAKQDEAFNRWYDGIDIPDVLKVPGYRRARRGLRLEVPQFPDGHSKDERDQYIALYDIETPNIDRTMIDMLMASRKMEMTGRSTPLLKVVERLYFRQHGSSYASSDPQPSKRNRYLLIERVECCRDEATVGQLNEWYDREYVPEMMSVRGFMRATRYELYRVLMVEPKSAARFVTVYEIQADSPAEALDGRRRSLAKLQRAGRMSEWFNEQGTALYEQIKDVRAR